MEENEVRSSISRVGLMIRRDIRHRDGEDIIFMAMLSGAASLAGGAIALVGVGLARSAEKLPMSFLKGIADRAATPITYAGAGIALAGAAGVGVCIEGLREHNREQNSLMRLIEGKTK